MVERILADFDRAWHAIRHLRYFNAAGADPDGEIGEIMNPDTFRSRSGPGRLPRFSVRHRLPGGGSAIRDRA
jgi:UDP-arabinose 4-epimerase